MWWLYISTAVLGLSAALSVLLFSQRAKRAKAWQPPYPGHADGKGRHMFGDMREHAFQAIMDAFGQKTVVIDTMIATADPQLMKTLLNSRPHSLGRSWLYRLFARVLPYADGILFMEHEDWRKRHRAFTPLFTTANVQIYSLAMLRAAVAEAEAVSVLQATVAVAGDKLAAAAHSPSEAAGQLQQLVSGAQAARGVLGCLVDAGRSLRPTPCPCAAGVGRCPLATHSVPSVGAAAVASPHVHLAATPLSAAALCAGAGSAAESGRLTAIRSRVDDFAYRGPRPEEDLLTFVRWIAMRVLAAWALPLHVQAAGGDSSSSSSSSSDYAAASDGPAGQLSSASATVPSSFYFAGCLARSLDSYARTVFEQFGEVGVDHTAPAPAACHGSAGFSASAASNAVGASPPEAHRHSASAPLPAKVGALTAIGRGLRLYARLWRLGFNIRRCTDTLVDAALAAGAKPALPLRGSWGLPADRRPQPLLCSNTNASICGSSVDAKGVAATGSDSQPAPSATSQPATPVGTPAAAAAAAPCPPNFLHAMLEGGFARGEIAGDVNHLHGAHKAIAFTTTAALFELSQPQHAAWRAAVVAELEAVCGRPPFVAPADAATGADGVAAAAVGTVPRLLAALTSASAAAAASAPAGAGPAATPASAGPAGWRTPTRADVEAGRLPTLQRVWKETLRLHAVSLGTLRKTGEPLTDPTTGAVIPAGTDIQLLLHTLHTHPAHWGPDALRWDPDRWLLGAPNGPRCPDVFMPFLDGLRRCAGMYLAETEFTLLTYALLVLYDTRVAFPLVPSPASTAAAAAAASPSEAALRPPRVEWITHSAIIPAAALSDASAVAAAEAAALGHPITATGTAAEATGVSGASCTAAAALAGASLATGEQQSQQQLPRWKLRLRADMFSAFDGVIPFTVSPRWR